MKHILVLAFSFICLLAYSQKTAKTLKITYQKTYNGNLIEENTPLIVFSNNRVTRITNQTVLDSKASFPYEEIIVDHNSNTYVQLATLAQQNFVATKDTANIAGQTFTYAAETKKILGFTCKKATTVINSNAIELWYTDALGIKASPSVLGQDLGAVLEMSRNGNYSIKAVKTEKIRNADTLLNCLPVATPMYSMADYRDKIWNARFTTITVFENEVINFSDSAKSNDTVFRFANGTLALRKIKFPVIKPRSQVFTELTEQSAGDAYDRTGTVFVIPQENEKSFLDGLKNGIEALPVYENGNGTKYPGMVITNEYLPLLELMRFFTPFGIKQYNKIIQKGKEWHEIVPYREDISELQHYISGKELWVGTFIGNYDKGGHTISLNITIHPEESVVTKPGFILPLFNTVSVMEMAQQGYPTMFDTKKGLTVNFTLDKNVKNAQLRYITTGHGGWENGDEFVPKKNRLILDGKEVFAFVPWRQDCGSYRLFNPASGNFENGLSSSDYSRSNWCPGTVTNPVFIDLGNLKAGKHTLTVTIPQGEPEGSSFSYWNISGVLLGEN